MEFDPLSFFTAEKVEEEQSLKSHIDESQHQYNHHKAKTLEIANKDWLDVEEDVDQNEGQIHILDLPVLSPTLPRVIIITLLELLKPDQITNFGQVEDIEEKSKENILDSKSISQSSFQITRNWLTENGYTHLSNNLLNIRFSQDLFAYVNKILSSKYYTNDEEVLRLASLRISENCGRTAKPQFQRKIVVNNLSTPIFLNEPALTSDSLGLKTWGSSLILSELLSQRHRELIVEPVLELGAGTGLVGITLGKLGYDVILTDLPEILRNLELNIETNGLTNDSMVLDWTDPSSFIEKKGNGKYNTIVIADPIYSPDHPRWVINMVKIFLEASGDARVLLQLPVREKFEKERELLWKIIEEENLETVEENEMTGYDDFGAQKFIYKQLRWIR